MRLFVSDVVADRGTGCTRRAVIDEPIGIGDLAWISAELRHPLSRRLVGSSGWGGASDREENSGDPAAEHEQRGIDAVADKQHQSDDREQAGQWIDDRVP